MAISRDMVLLPVGTYELGQRAGAPDPLQDLREGEFSLHHILPYRYPLFIGFLAKTYKTSFVGPQNQENWPAGSTDRIGMLTAGILSVVSRFGGQNPEIPSRFAWMGPNLFQGPSGNYRIDDPHSDPEPLKLLSYRQDRWDALQQVKNKINELVPSLKNPGYTATTTRAITVGDFEDLLNLLRPIADAGHGNAHTFEETDWMVMSPKDPNFSKNSFAPNVKMTETVKSQFKALPPDKINFFRPSYSGAAMPRNPTPYLWRLRQSTETVPTDAIIGPRLQ